MAGWAANGAKFTGRYFGPSPLVTWMVRVIDRAQHHQIAACFRPGDTGAMEHRYGGDLGPLQAFIGFNNVGAAGGVRAGFNQLLPGTTALPDRQADLLPGAPR